MYLSEIVLKGDEATYILIINSTVAIHTMHNIGWIHNSFVQTIGYDEFSRLIEYIRIYNSTQEQWNTIHTNKYLTHILISYLAVMEELNSK
jgi:hypothetical protein